LAHFKLVYALYCLVLLEVLAQILNEIDEEATQPFVKMFLNEWEFFFIKSDDNITFRVFFVLAFPKAKVHKG
jgi:hypothetical protein